mmetsp:Transcript_35363/g.118210  ORF Transcript_35363/g.118210 Transcript_35363/m.118210 type:complete len:209 (+) Transcript_35363:474-1100(+)
MATGASSAFWALARRSAGLCQLSLLEQSASRSSASPTGGPLPSGAGGASSIAFSSASTCWKAVSPTSRKGAVALHVTEWLPSSTMKPLHPSWPQRGMLFRLTYELTQCLSRSREPKVSASSGPAQPTQTKVASSPYLTAQRSMASAHGQHPPHPVKRWRTAGLPGLRMSERGTSVSPAFGRGYGVTSRTALIGGASVGAMASEVGARA